MKAKRQLLVAGNWKMNKLPEEAVALALAIANKPVRDGVKVVIAPTFLNLIEVKNALPVNSHIQLAAQNCHFAPKGAYTGEVSAPMLVAAGVEYVILGHSERREYFNETPELLRLKVEAALAAGLKVIFCCGEKLEAREAEQQFDVVERQLVDSLSGFAAKDWERIIIAYEPVWAIGTGLTASAEQAQGIHYFIRQFIANEHGEEVAEAVQILYGGSCNPTNASNLFAQPDIDGGLIGGASLVADDFSALMNIAHLVYQQTI